MSEAPGIAGWREAESAFDRVRAVAVTLDRPRTAAWIADEAAVAENTARDHLERLVEMRVLRAREVGHGTRYEPDPLYRRMRAMQELLDGRTRDDLLGLQAQLLERIEEWQDTHGVPAPTALRERAADAEDAATTRELRTVAGDWELLAYRLGLVREALERYGEYTGPAPANA